MIEVVALDFAGVVFGIAAIVAGGAKLGFHLPGIAGDGDGRAADAVDVDVGPVDGSATEGVVPGG